MTKCFQLGIELKCQNIEDIKNSQVESTIPIQSEFAGLDVVIYQDYDNALSQKGIFMREFVEVLQKEGYTNFTDINIIIKEFELR
jgi:hypothetical protein